MCRREQQTKIQQPEEKKMLKKLMLIGALVTTMVFISDTNVNAQFFDGWGWFGFSSVRGFIDLSKVPPPQSKPSVVVATATLNQVQIACKNPANNGISPGKSFTSELTSFNSLDSGDITDRKRGKATVLVAFSLDEFEDDANCQNPNWHKITNSAMVLSFSADLEWFACTGEDLNGDGDADPCTDMDSTGQEVFTINETAKGLLDAKTVTCTLNTTAFPRNSDGTAPSSAQFPPLGVRFDCTPPQ
jgi:hypothetical protein